MKSVGCCCLHLDLIVVRPVGFVGGPQQQQQYDEDCNELPSEERHHDAPYARAEAARELHVGDVVALGLECEV